ncbi:hypothetical protein PV377_03195 [Streptomyces ipomoeae]|uniref:hypothetical protein n=1 Tax=Streptomyces ipomoeae TaxID=103232 RepID=UPI0029A9CA48|nr:hypothetical protein [Streptomyces ipomoeae]MDX2838019.1 hypothetical protein [Streptomyces ipomoeae]
MSDTTTTGTRERLADIIRQFPFDNYGLDDVSYLLEEDPGAAEVAAARKYAAEMRDFCSPHSVSVHYADQLTEAMDRAKER